MSLNSVLFNFRLAKKGVTHHIHHANSEVKATVKYFTKQGIIYDIIKKYSTYHRTNFLPKSDRPSKTSDQQLKTLMKTVENKTRVSQRRLARRFAVNHSTISRVLKARTSVKILKRKTAPKYSNEDQQRRAQ